MVVSLTHFYHREGFCLFWIMYEHIFNKPESRNIKESSKVREFLSMKDTARPPDFFGTHALLKTVKKSLSSALTRARKRNRRIKKIEAKLSELSIRISDLSDQIDYLESTMKIAHRTKPEAQKLSQVIILRHGLDALLYKLRELCKLGRIGDVELILGYVSGALPGNLPTLNEYAGVNLDQLRHWEAQAVDKILSDPRLALEQMH